MASITVSDGKFAVYRTDKADASNPYANIKAEEDGAASPTLVDHTGKVWIFYIVVNGSNYDLKYYRSTDTIGSAWDASTLIKANVSQGVPGREQLSTGRIVAYYYKPNVAGKKLLVVPTGTIAVAKEAGTLVFIVANGGKDNDMAWTAAVVGDGFSISSGASGTEVKKDNIAYRSYSDNAGASWTEEVIGTQSIVVAYTANTGDARSATLTITAAGATGSPVTITINQAKGN